MRLSALEGSVVVRAGTGVRSCSVPFTKSPQNSCSSVDWGGGLLGGIHGPMRLALQPKALLGDGGWRLVCQFWGGAGSILVWV